MISSKQDGSLADDEALEPAEGRAEPLEAGHELVEGDAEPEAERRRGEGVVDVVEAGHGKAHAGATRGGRERERDSVEPFGLDRARRDVERWPLVAADLAAVGAEVADVDGLVAVRMAAADAVLRVGGVRERRSRARRVVDAEPDHGLAVVGERGDERVVGVDGENRVRCERLHRRPPPLGDVLELAVAVELIPEEIAEGDDARLRAPDHLGEDELVHLEEPQLRVTRGEKRRGDARGEVRAGVVPGEAAGGGEDRAGHGGRRRLAVRRRDEGHTLGECSGELVQSRGVELPDELPRERRAAAAARGA